MSGIEEGNGNSDTSMKGIEGAGEENTDGTGTEDGWAALDPFVKFNADLAAHLDDAAESNDNNQHNTSTLAYVEKPSERPPVPPVERKGMNLFVPFNYWHILTAVIVRWSYSVHPEAF